MGGLSLWPQGVAPPTRRRLARLLAWGLLLRLLCLPFCAHLDLLTEYWVAHVRAHDGRFPLEVMGGIFAFSLTHYFHVATLLALDPWLPPIHDVFLHPWGTADDPGMTTDDDWRAFLGHPRAPRLLALFKLPYLGLELVAFALLLRLGRNDRETHALARFWLLNPILVFGTYVFGRYEILSVLVVTAAVLAVARGRLAFGMVAIGLGGILKMYPFLLAPCAVLGLSRRLPARARLSAWVLAPGAVLLALAVVIGRSSEFGTFSSIHHNDYLFNLRLPTSPSQPAAPGHMLLLYPLALFLLWLHLDGRTRGGPEAAPRDVTDRFVAYGLATFLLLYGLCFFHPHYALWAMPLWALAAARDPWLDRLFWAHLPFYAVYTFHWGPALWSRLVAGIHPERLWDQPAPFDALGVAGPAVLSLTRAILTALFLVGVVRAVGAVPRAAVAADDELTVRSRQAKRLFRQEPTR